MSSLESDSSFDEDDNFTETNVLLGYASKEAPEDTISHLGGRPQWIDPATPPPITLVKCKVCHELMVLLLQLNGDLPEVFPGHQRRLYILACRKKTCKRKNGSVRALRGLRISADVNEKQQHTTSRKSKTRDTPVTPTINLGEALFGGKPTSSLISNPFSTAEHVSNPFSSSTATAPATPFSTKGETPLPDDTIRAAPKPEIEHSLSKTFAETLSLNTPAPSVAPAAPEIWPPDAEWPAAYPQYYLADADYEVLEAVAGPALPAPTMTLDDDGRAEGGRIDKEVFESSIDKTFQRFADRLAQNPEQVIRYEFNGQPLLYSRHDAVGKLLGDLSSAGHRIPRCASCGARRVFELQLTPHAIMELEREESSLDGMEWGTILVGVCEEDCQPPGVGAGVGYVEEWAGVQWEELRGGGR